MYINFFIRVCITGFVVSWFYFVVLFMHFQYSARNMDRPEQPVHSPHGGPFRDQPKDSAGCGVLPFTDRPPGGSLEGSRIAEWSQPSLHPMQQSPPSPQWRKPQLCAPRVGSPQTHNNAPMGLESTSSQPYGHREQHFRPPSSNLPPVLAQGEGHSSASSQHGLQMPLKPTQPRKLYIIDDVLDPTNKDSPSHVSSVFAYTYMSVEWVPRYI